MTNNEKILELLSKAQVFYLTTVEENRPRCRPISFVMEVDGKVYFAVGTYKNVYRQLQANPNVEICGYAGQNFLRYYGKAVFDTNPALVERALDTMPILRNMYNEQSGYVLGVFSLANATADICGITGAVEESIAM